MSKHFKAKEFACNCCGVSKVDPSLYFILELVRQKFGKPVIITSAYRCLNHNRAVGSSDRSQHPKGTAADIKISGIEPEAIYSYLNTLFPNTLGLGLYSTFTHIDVREECARWHG